MKILVPIDFNKSSFAAYRYASLLAETLDAEITLLHVITGSFNTGDTISIEPMQTMENTAIERLAYISRDYAVENGLTLPRISDHHVVRWGMPGFTISDYAEDKGYDLIVMGSRDKYGFFDRLLGSSSALTIRRSTMPVLLIHSTTPITLPSKIAFAYDQYGKLEASIAKYKTFNNIIGAATTFVHVRRNDGSDISGQKQTIIEELLDQGASANFTIDTREVEDSSVAQGLMDFCLFEKKEMLAVMHRDEGLFSTLFGSHTSIKLAQDFHLPVMVFSE